MLVDDEAMVRELVTAQLESLGYRVLPKADAVSAFDLLEQGEPVDVLLTDVSMPGEMDGYELACMARERQPDLKVLLISGYPDQDRSAAPKGSYTAVRFPLLSKPYRREDLREQLDALLGGTS